MAIPITEPPIQVTYHGLFHTGADADLFDEPRRRTYQQAARRVAFRALTSQKPAAQLLHVTGVARTGEPAMGGYSVVGGWLIADTAGTVTAHRGVYAGLGGPWDLANAIVPGSADAVQSPVLTGHYRDHPEAYRELLTNHAASLQRLLDRHGEALGAGHLYATMHLHADPTFVGLLREAVEDRSTQLIFHDWLAEQGFPHSGELLLKRWNKGKWTEKQLLDLLTKPFASARRSFSGRTV